LPQRLPKTTLRWVVQKWRKKMRLQNRTLKNFHFIVPFPLLCDFSQCFSQTQGKC
jgi:hypothetical protein